MAHLITLNTEKSSESYFKEFKEKSNVSSIAELTLQSKKEIAGHDLSQVTVSATEELVGNPTPLAECWDVFAYSQNQAGGSRIHLRLKDPYDNPETAYTEAFKQKEREIFPAIEPNEKRLKNMRIRRLRPMGFDYRSDSTGCYLILVDQVGLEANYENYRRRHPELKLKPLKIAPSDGVATHMEYAKAYFSGALVLLSKGKEFVHDFIVHIFPTLLVLLSNPEEYYEERARLEGIIERMYNQIAIIEETVKDGDPSFTEEELKKIHLIIGGFTDAVWSITSMEQMKATREEMVFEKPYEFLSMWQSPDYRRFWSKQTDEEFSRKQVSALWKRCLEFEKPLPKSPT